MAEHLEKRRRLWYGVLDVPIAQRGVLGKRRFVESLGTDSLSVAKIKVLPVLHAWRVLIEEAKSGKTGASQFTHFIDKQRKAGVPECEVQEAAEALAVDMGNTAVASYLISTGKIVLLSAHLQPFLDELPDNQTKATKARQITVFLSAFTYADEVTTESLEDFVANKLSHLATGTQTNHISSFKAFWRYLAKKRLVPRTTEFFKDVVAIVPTKTDFTKTDDKRKHFVSQDYHKLLGSIDMQNKRGRDMHNLIQLGAYTGCRIEEICSLKVEDVNLSEGCFTVRDAKTEAGNRSVPIHPAISELVVYLVGATQDGFLMSGLPACKHGRRSNSVGNPFSKLKASLGYGPCHVFHSFRKGVATQLESAGIPEFVAARILGHKFHTMTYGLYSGGANIETLKQAISVLKW